MEGSIWILGFDFWVVTTRLHRATWVTLAFDKSPSMLVTQLTGLNSLALLLAALYLLGFSLRLQIGFGQLVITLVKSGADVRLSKRDQAGDLYDQHNRVFEHDVVESDEGLLFVPE
jgi:hypothetical protein